VQWQTAPVHDCDTAPVYGGEQSEAKKAMPFSARKDDPDIYGEEISVSAFGSGRKGYCLIMKVLIFTVSDTDVPAAFQEALPTPQ
jgi:hypothetical protein